MKRLVFFLLIVLACSASPLMGAGLKMSIQDGLVSIDAQDVTVRQILTEWARVGQTQIINVERITGGPITLKLENVPEKQALDIILRTIPGYVAVPRSVLAADASMYDRILIMATTTAVAAPRPQPSAPPFPGAQSGMTGLQGGTFTQLRQGPSAPLTPGVLPDPANAQDPADDPAIAAAAAAGLVPVPATNPGPTSIVPAPLMPPGGANQPPATQPAPGAGAPTNPWNIPAGTAQPSLAPPAPTVQAPPAPRVRPPQADR
jgi:hypothetical protein